MIAVKPETAVGRALECPREGARAPHDGADARTSEWAGEWPGECASECASEGPRKGPVRDPQGTRKGPVRDP